MIKQPQIEMTFESFEFSHHTYPKPRKTPILMVSSAFSVCEKALGRGSFNLCGKAIQTYTKSIRYEFTKHFYFVSSKGISL